MMNEPTNTTAAVVSMVCGPTCGCGKSTPFVRAGSGWMSPSACVHCGKSFGAPMLVGGGAGSASVQYTLAPSESATITALRSELETAKRERAQFWRWAYALNLAAAKLALTLRNAELRENGESRNWPAQQEWSELGSTSHSVFLRQAREAACIDHDAFLAYVRGADELAEIADDLYEQALASSQSRPSTTPTNRRTEMEIGEFHHTNGWYFKRLDDGSVRIRVGEAKLQVIPPREWASIVAHLAHVAPGDEAEKYTQACALHGVE